MNKNLSATGILSGTIIGAGIFSLPYVFSQVGLLYGLFYLIGFALVYFVIHSMYAELLLKEPGQHQFFYLAKKYLPSHIARIASFSILAELVLVLVAYLILAGVFMELALGLGGTSGVLIFWIIGSVFIFTKLRWLGWIDFLDTIGILVIIAVISFAGFDKQAQNISIVKDLSLPLLFLPFGPMLFSLSGRPGIAKVVEEYNTGTKKNPDSLKKVIWAGTFIPAVLYFLFAFSVLRLSPNVSSEALSGLNVAPSLLALMGAVGIITIWTSYFMIGVNVKDILRLDVGWTSWWSGVAAVFFPIALYFLGVRDFLGVVGFVGGILLALEGIFVVAMWRKALPNSKWRRATPLLYVIFLAAMFYQIAIVL
ncbi:MAG: aromatic amino acid transport family protein [Patescibacteria group bacterium]